MIKKVLILFVGIVILSSCGTNATDLNKPESFTKIKELALSKFGGDKEIYKFSIQTKDHLTSEVSYLNISYLEDKLDYGQMYFLSLNGKEKLEEPEKARDSFQKKFFLKNKQGKVKIKDLDFSIIEAKYDEGIGMISNEYESFTLHSWTYNVNNKGEITADFTIEGRKKGESTSMQGRNIVTNYYEFPFKMNVDKSIEAK